MAPATQYTVGRRASLLYVKQCLTTWCCGCCWCRPHDHPHELDQDLKDRVKQLTQKDLDALLSYVEDQLNLSLTAESSSNLVTRVLSECQNQKDIANSFVQTLPKNLTKEITSFFLPLLKQTLGGMGGVHWAGLGLSFIAWSLDNLDRTSRNHENCLKLLRKVVPLLSNVRSLVGEEDIHDDHHCIQALQDSTEIALRCAIICSSSLNQAYLFRFFKAANVEELISAMEKELDGAKVTNINIGVSAILKKLPKAYGPVTFTSGDESIVGGGAEQMQTALNFLKEDCDIAAVCLHGMGGIGKSTLGLSIYKKFQASGVYRCGMLELPLEIPKREELPIFQWQILQQVCKGEIPKFSSGVVGKERMQQELPKCGAIFLYLDNVLGPGHLLELLPNKNIFAHGSKILITTRNENVFRDLKKLRIEHCECIEVKKLKKKEAEELFLSEIGRDRVVGASKEIQELKGKVLELCAGLPLALKIVGGYIAKYRDEMDVEHWRDVVEKMREAVPLEGEGGDDPLYSPLKFSINQLHVKFKRAFWDILAFGIGRSRQYAEGLVGKVCLQDLLGRSLLQLAAASSKRGRPRQVIRVHDVIYTIGKQMASDDHSEIRIVSEEEFQNLKNIGSSSLEKIVGLGNIQISKADLLLQMPRLRVLHGVFIEVECEIKENQHLKSVKISSCILAARPIHFSACSGLRQVIWDTDAIPDLEVFKGLKELEALSIMRAKIDRVHAIETLTSLKMLRFSMIKHLEYLPEGISCLTGLTDLDLGGCGLQLLPEGISCLTGLKYLDLSHCGSLQLLPEGISRLTGLKYLGLGSCKSLQLLPEGISGLTGLIELGLDSCKSLQLLPEGISCLTGLTELGLDSCKSLQLLPEGISCLTGLKSLDLDGCKSLQSLPEGIRCLTGLESLDLGGCESLQLLPEGISCLTCLIKLNLGSCKSLQLLPEGISFLTGLTDLVLVGCESLQLLPEGISCLTGLTRLYLDGCKSLQLLPEGISCLTGLKYLGGCENLQLLPEGISCLTGLTRLDLRGCGNLLQSQLPEGISCLTGLEILRD